ncbi:SIP domain-containing protein [Micromonospora chersina]|uniref:SIP domain-containing protein n=1 Tax=Micromonospora chersina TaxID=47854 RepID=UPI003CC56EBB
MTGTGGCWWTAAVCWTPAACTPPCGSGDAHYWVAVEAASTRDITRHLRRTLGVGRHQVTSLGYWSVR